MLRHLLYVAVLAPTLTGPGSLQPTGRSKVVKVGCFTATHTSRAVGEQSEMDDSGGDVQ